MTTLTRVGEFALTWGESLRWDDRRDRLYLVDCATQQLHWLEGAEPPLQSMPLPSMPAGLALTEDHRVIACLDDGLHVIDPDAGTTELLTAYPEGMLGRANDARADGSGNLVTGTLNLGPAPGASWWYSAAGGWRVLDDDIANTNGPVVIDVDGESTLVLADTAAAAVYAYPYDGRSGTVGDRRVFGDHQPLGGVPDGATADVENGVWSCVLGVGKIAPFGGPGLDRMFVVSIALNLGEAAEPTAEAGWLLVVDGLGVSGRPEPRFDLG